MTRTRGPSPAVSRYRGRWSHPHPSPRSACGHGSRLTDRRHGGASASHVCRGLRVSRPPTHLPRRWTDPCCRARDGGPRRAAPVADSAADADCAGRASYRRERRGRGALSRTARARTLRPGAAGDDRGAAGSGRSRWRDPSSAAARRGGRSGGASRQRSPPRTTTMSHRHVERGPDCRSASSQRGTSSDTWDEPSTASLQCDSCGDEKGGPKRPTRRRSFMQQRHQPSASTARHVRGVIGHYSRRRTASTSTSEGSPNPRPYPNKSATVVEPNRLSSSSR